MTKSHKKKTARGIVFLIMLAVSPLAMTDSYASEGGKDSQKNAKSADNIKKESLLRAILTEKVINGKLEVRQYALPEDVSPKDMQRMLTVGGETVGWAYVNYKTYQEGIVLFDGKVSKNGENFWMISDFGTNFAVEGQILKQSSERSDNNSAIADNTSIDEDLRYRVIFSGKMAETESDNVFTIFPSYEPEYNTIQDINSNNTKQFFPETLVGIDQKFRNYDVVK